MPSAQAITGSAIRRTRQKGRALILILDRLFLDDVPEIPVRDQGHIEAGLGATEGHHFRPQVHTSRAAAQHVKRMVRGFVLSLGADLELTRTLRDEQAEEALAELSSEKVNDEAWCRANENQPALRIQYDRITNLFNRSQVLQAVSSCPLI